MSPTPVATTTPTVAPTASPTPEPTLAPTPEPTVRPTPVPTAPPQPDVNARNEKQWIVARPDPALDFHTGEAPVPATIITNYRLNGESLAGGVLQCTDQTTGQICNELRILPPAPLVNAQRYELTLLGIAIGSFTARGLVAATPHVVAVSADQFQLAVTFDRPMLHVGTCGQRSWSLVAPGTIEYVRSYIPSWPPGPGAYTSSDDGYRDFIRAFLSEAVLSDDCRSVTLGSGWGAPTGTFDLTISGVEDEDGNLVQPRTFSVEIADEGPPKLMFAQLELQTAEKKVIRVAYSEAMDEEYVTDIERYYLNGKPVPADTKIACELANCAWVGLTFAPTAFTYGANNTLTIVGVRDTAGNTMQPDIVTSGTFQVY